MIGIRIARLSRNGMILQKKLFNLPRKYFTFGAFRRGCYAANVWNHAELITSPYYHYVVFYTRSTNKVLSNGSEGGLSIIGVVPFGMAGSFYSFTISCIVSTVPRIGFCQSLSIEECKLEFLSKKFFCKIRTHTWKIANLCHILWKVEVLKMPSFKYLGTVALIMAHLGKGTNRF